MRNTMIEAKKVEELSRFGQPLDDLPEGMAKTQEKIALAEIKNKYGRFGKYLFFTRMFLEQRRLRRKYPDAMVQLRSFGPGAVKEMLMLVAMFNIIAKSEGRESAYEFVKGMFQEAAAQGGISALYQMDELLECDGDVFDNFKKFNIAMIEASAHLFHPARIENEEDKLTFTIDRCANVDIANALGCPDLTPIGCDFDLAGYPTIVDRVNTEFRRPCTIAKGGEYCKFLFYRKGTAPEMEEIYGRTVMWEDRLNK